MTRSARDRQRARALWGALVVAAAAGGGCSRDDGPYFGTTERRGKDVHTFYVNNYSEPEYLDPGLSAESAGTTLINELFEGLGQLHPHDQHPVQGVATRYDRSADNRLFRFYLRDDAKWSDGKPVTAHDFVYSWQRVLTPETGSRMATLMYPLKNGKLFHQGRLKRTASATALEPLDGAARALPEGTAVEVLTTSPAKTRRAPLEAAQAEPLSYDPKTGALERGGAAVPGDALPEPASARVLDAGAPVRCNDADSRWYQVEVARRRGWLPGCALDADAQAERALVEIFEGLPRFRPAPPEDPDGAEDAGDTGEAPATRGFVAQAALRSDPNVIGVRAVGDRTLEVELGEPTPYFLELVSYGTYFPVRKDVIEHWAAQGKPDHWTRPGNMINNGAYLLETHRFRYEITMVRNPHHYAHDQLKIHRIVWMMVTDSDACMALYKTGELDYIGQNVSPPAAQLDRLSTFRDFDLSNWLAVYWYEFNTAKPPVDDARVRRALNLATDKQQLVDSITRGKQMPARHFVPDFSGSGYAEALDAAGKAGRRPFAGKGYDYDPELARALLREAGYHIEERDDGWYAADFPPLEILYNTHEGHQKIAVALQDQWKRNLGIAVTLRNEEWKVMLKNLRDGHFQIGRGGWVADYNHPHTYLDTFLSYSANNWTRWSDSKFDALVAEAAATADPEESIRRYIEAEQLAVDAMSKLPLYFYTKSTLIKPYVKGFYPNGNNRHNVRWMWIDEGWQAGGDNVPALPPQDFPEPGSFE